MSKLWGKDNPSWKGDKAGYGAMHDWIRRLKGRASEHSCEFADETCKGPMEWSNISGKYLRKVSDWQTLCNSHHKRIDMTDERRKKISERVFTKEWRENLSKSHMGNRQTQESKDKISQTLKEYWRAKGQRTQLKLSSK